jgi:threonine synthase
MNVSCVACGLADNRLDGYCRACGGIRLVDEPAPTRDRLSPAREPTPVRPSRVPGLEGVLLKLEGANPTGSFKDRVMEVLVAEAGRADVAGAVVASSGNAAVAASAACAAAALPLLVVVPATTPDQRVLPAALRGATIVRVDAEVSRIHALCARLAASFGLANLSSTFAAPGCEWACRQIGRELAEQVPGPITHLVAPVSAGPVLIGSGRGLRHAARTAPSLVATQASGCAPIAEAFAAGWAKVAPWSRPIATRAAAIADTLAAYPQDGTFTLEQIRASGGFAAAVADDELNQMRQDLAVFDGVDAELSSCAAPAVWRRHRTAGTAGGVVCVLTGNGLKDTLTGPARPTPAVSDYATATGTGPRLVEEVARWPAA